MAKVRKDLVGTVLAVDEYNNFEPLTAGQEIPEGFFVGGHAVHKGDPRDQTPPWKQPVTPPDALATAEPAPVAATTPVANTPPAQQEQLPEPVPVPPKSGTGSSVEAWRAYAVDAIARSGLQIDIPDDVKRDEIIAALADAKIPTE